ncbi:hemolysin family protein [Marinigracilibium pacificum]|uniref:HlyC/CorC family transporter n=1 Tax=Marinigracilibium pacificum TaxID=2729599 RepID=A0A848IX07_9BACT|nr:hemolysin family protein [Marinigracilibium pacificum]NMM46794.1 HlyC/CorC family transporter [Marinigracilibium pacificum]
MNTEIIIIFLSLLFSALFSGIEIAFISANKLHLELGKNETGITAKALRNITRRPSLFIATLLTGNTIALSVYGIFMAKILLPVIHEWLPGYVDNQVVTLAIQTAISTLLVLATAEFLPKSIFLINPNAMLSFFAPIMSVLYYFLLLFVYPIEILSRFVINKVFRLNYADDRPAFGLNDLEYYVKETLESKDEDVKVEVNTKILTNALEFKSVKVRECMVPRTEIVAIDMDDVNMEEVRKSFIESGHSKILVYNESIDDIKGYCHSMELFKKPKELDQILNPILIVPETMQANELLIQFINDHKSLALVVDEFGGTSGIVTIEDIIEEIFGDIQDEHDEEDWLERKLEEDKYLLSARHEIDDLIERHNWPIPEGDYDTLGGYILSITEDIPEEGQIIENEFFKITIKTIEEARIDTVELEVKNSERYS